MEGGGGGGGGGGREGDPHRVPSLSPQFQDFFVFCCCFFFGFGHVLDILGMSRSSDNFKQWQNQIGYENREQT